MKRFFGRFDFSPTRVFSYALFVLSGAILLVSLLLTMNVTVLKDWQLVIPEGPYHAGQTITVISKYEKVRDVTGIATRYLECRNSGGVYIRYPLNEAEANRAKGKGGTGVVVKLPNTIPDLPTTCKFTIAIKYDVYPWRRINQTASSNEFQLLAP